MGSRETVGKIRDKWEGILVFDGVRIRASIILNGSQFAISLLDEKEGGRVG